MKSRFVTLFSPLLYDLFTSQVEQLAGYVAGDAVYHHGEANLMQTIIGLAQNYMGSNNINLLEPEGQYGTRETGGKDHASARYIFTKLSPISRAIFHPDDDPLLNALQEDGCTVEPEWYMPVIPLVLVNGAEGIGTGTSRFMHPFTKLTLL
jgi:DNA topoisomerase-2